MKFYYINYKLLYNNKITKFETFIILIILINKKRKK